MRGKYETNKINFLNEHCKQIRLYEYAEEGSSLFSKIRISVPKRVNRNWTRKISVWQIPNLAKEIGKIEVVRKSRPIYKHPISIYSLEHERVESLLTPANIIDYSQFIEIKDYFAVKRLRMVVNSNLSYQIVYSHHPSIIERLREAQKEYYTTSESISDLSDYIRGFWIIEYQADRETRSIKLPSYHGRMLITTELMTSEKPIQLTKRKNILSKRNCYGERYISYLYYLLDNNRPSYINIIQKNTLYNLRGLISDNKLLKECVNNQINFRKEKLEAPDEFY